MIGLGKVTQPVATDNLFSLIVADILLVVHLSVTWPLTASLPSIALPLRPFNSGPLDELYPSWENGRVIIVHCILLFAHLAFLLSLIVLLFVGLPAALFAGYAFAIFVANRYVCSWLLNGPETKYFAGKEFAKNPEDDGTEWVSGDPSHEGERWIFINGVAAGSHWMNANLSRLSKTFRRPIIGIHNSTFGIVFDIIECIIQRTFDYPTLDIRNAYKTISGLLIDDNVTKLVLVAHSQGTIEAGMVIDWLIAATSAEQLSKLEIYTFGNAANHWNCATTEKGPLIKHVEHYANGLDWVARLGIFQFRQRRDPKEINGSKGRQMTEHPRFGGRLFKRIDCLGHQMNMHYLDNIFVMDEKLERVLDDDDLNDRSENGAYGAGTRFMEMEVDQEMLAREDTVVPVQQELGHGRALKQGAHRSSRFKVKDLSRLWEYRNGRTPEGRQPKLG